MRRRKKDEVYRVRRSISLRVRICSEVLKAIRLRANGRTPQVCAWGGLWNLVPGFRPRGSQEHEGTHAAANAPRGLVVKPALRQTAQIQKAKPAKPATLQHPSGPAAFSRFSGFHRPFSGFR
jgi:hypothetical protein